METLSPITGPWRDYVAAMNELKAPSIPGIEAAIQQNLIKIPPAFTGVVTALRRDYTDLFVPEKMSEMTVWVGTANSYACQLLARQASDRRGETEFSRLVGAGIRTRVNAKARGKS